MALGRSRVSSRRRKEREEYAFEKEKTEVKTAIVHDVHQLLGSTSGGVQGGHHAAHGGAGDDVDGDVVFLEPLQDADLGEAEGAAAAEGKADARPGERLRGWLRGSDGGQGGVLAGSRPGGGAGGGFAVAALLTLLAGRWAGGGGSALLVGSGLFAGYGHRRFRTQLRLHGEGDRQHKSSYTTGYAGGEAETEHAISLMKLDGGGMLLKS